MRFLPGDDYLHRFDLEDRCGNLGADRPLRLLLYTRNRSNLAERQISGEAESQAGD